MKPLKINPAYRALVPRPTKEEYEALERSIIEHHACARSWGTEENTICPLAPSEKNTDSPSGDVKALWSSPMG